MEEVLVSSFNASRPVAKLLIEKGLITKACARITAAAPPALDHQ
jgi:hypothetical protein